MNIDKFKSNVIKAMDDFIEFEVPEDEKPNFETLKYYIKQLSTVGDIPMVDDNPSDIQCSLCGTINNAHHSAECIDTNGQGYHKQEVKEIDTRKLTKDIANYIKEIKTICDKIEISAVLKDI